MQQKPKFGTKSSSFPGQITQKASNSEKTYDPFRSALTKGTPENNSSSSILGKLKQRKLEGALTVTSTTLKKSVESSSPEAEKSAKKSRITDETMMEDIVTFVKYHSVNPGEATSEELVTQFGEELGVGKNAIFKAMLQQVCSKSEDSVTGKTLWTLNAEFSSRGV